MIGNSIIFAVVAALLFGVSGALFKFNNVVQGNLNIFFSGLYFFGACGFAITTMSRSGLFFSTDYLISGAVVGLGVSFGNYLFSKSLSAGPISLGIMMINLNLVIIIIASVFWYGETLSLAQLVGIFILLLAFVLSGFKFGESFRIRNAGWYFLIIGAIIGYTVRNGGLKVTADIGLESTNVLFYAYSFSFLWFAFRSVFSGYSKNFNLAGPQAAAAKSLGIGAASGIFSFAGLGLYGLSLEIGSASILAPIFSSYTLIASGISLLFFNETLSKQEMVAFVLAFIGIVVLSVT